MAENRASGGMTNADFARIFRQQARQEEVPVAAAHSDSTIVFADADADEDDFQPRGFGFGGASHRNDFMTRGQAPQLGGGRQQDEDEPATQHGGLGANNSAGLGVGATGGSIGFQDFTRASDATQEPKKNEVSTMSKAQLANHGKREKHGAWEKHTKGFGMKMLSKMGFKGRLGKDERGVSSTVKVVQRPALMGIGYGNFTEASALEHNRKLQRELKGETVEDEAARKRQEAEALDEDDSLWRKRKAVPVGGGAAKKKYKRAADVSHEAQTKAKTKRSDVILDMRGPDVRVLSNVSDAYDVDPQRVEAAKPKLGEELIHNVRMVVNLAQGQIYDLTSKLDRSDENIASLKKEANIIKSQVAMETVRLRHIDAMMTRMKQLKQEAASALESRDVSGIVMLLSDIREAFPQEFEAYKLHQLVSSLCISPLKALLTAVNLTKPEVREAIAQQFRLIQVFLLQVPSGKRTNSESTSGSIFHNIHEKVNSAGEDIYNFILEETLWPAVSQFVNYQWSVKAAPEQCSDLFELFRPHLSTDFKDAFLRQLVLPRLKKECQRWDPQSDTMLIHDWLLPWAPFLGDAMQSLYPDIRLTLANALNQWHPSDLSVLVVLSPWKQVWGEHEYAKFTHRHVVRKLIRCLHRDFEINPQQQSLEALTWVLAWKEHLPERQFIALFEGEFFPKWLKVLRRWVAAAEAPSLLELEKWYRGWKGFFDKQQLAEHRRLVVHFHGALVLLEAASDRYYQQLGEEQQSQQVGIPTLNKKAPTSYQDALVKAHNEDPTAEDGISSANDDSSNRSGPGSTFQYQEQPQQQKKKANHMVGLKDVIENLAIAHNVMFMPKGLHDGQQVYLFGKHHILIEQGVVFAEKSKGAFQPVDIEQLL